MGSETSSAPKLRADARRNAEQIRAAAVQVFQARGLGASLDEVARAAGVSKATVINRFGGRAGLVDAVVDDVARDLTALIEQTRAIAPPWERLAYYVAAVRDLHYRKPGMIDVLFDAPDTDQLTRIRATSAEMVQELVRDAHAEGTLRSDFTEDDLTALFVENALSLKHGPHPDRAGYDRRTQFLLDGFRASR